MGCDKHWKKRYSTGLVRIRVEMYSPNVATEQELFGLMLHAINELNINAEFEEKYKGPLERILVIRPSEPLKPDFESELQERYTSALEALRA